MHSPDFDSSAVGVGSLDESFVRLVRSIRRLERFLWRAEMEKHIFRDPLTCSFRSDAVDQHRRCGVGYGEIDQMNRPLRAACAVRRFKVESRAGPNCARSTGICARSGRSRECEYFGHGDGRHSRNFPIFVGKKKKQNAKTCCSGAFRSRFDGTHSR